MSEAIVDHRTTEELHSTAKFGMWMFLASEIMFFTGFIGSYIVLRIANPEVMANTADARPSMLDPWIGCLNTFVLIVSSLTMAFAVNSLARGSVAAVRRNLGVTVLLGAVFLVIKLAFEWYPKFQHHVDWSTSIFYSCYFLTTGFHGIHVIAGMVMMICLLACDDEYFRRHFGMVENTGLYWHFVDIVWIFLFPMFYLLP